MNIDYLKPIYNLLIADIDVMSIIKETENILFNDFPADTPRNIIIYEISELSNGLSKSNNKRIQINLYHTDKFKCAELSEYVKNCLHTFQGLTSNVMFTSIYMTNINGMLKTENDEYIIVQDYLVQY